MSISTITKILGGVLAVGVGWIGVLATIMLLSNDPPAVVVPFPSDAFLAALPQNVAISQFTRFGVVLVGDDPRFVSGLYNAGATVVLPAGLMGCAPLS